MLRQLKAIGGTWRKIPCGQRPVSSVVCRRGRYFPPDRARIIGTAPLVFSSTMGGNAAKDRASAGAPVEPRAIGSPTLVDLFSGAGGLAEGFRQAGWRVLAGVDNDPHAAATFRLNFPDAAFFEADVSKLDPQTLLETLRLDPGELDCLAGGPPCQSFSYNNHARSASGRRAKLFRHYLRIVEVLQPKTLVMENVPGMLTIGGGKIVAEIRRRLAKLGYEVHVRILYAEDFGVPQDRRRAFVVATRLGWEDSLFPRGTHGPSEKPALDQRSVQGRYIHRWKADKRRPPQPLVSVWDAIGDLPPAQEDRDLATRYRRKPRTSFQRHARGRRQRVTNHVAHALTTAGLRRIALVPEGGNWRDLPRRYLPAGMKRARPSDHTTRYGRLARKSRSATILTKCDPHWGSYVHPTEDRTITVREAARLQSFRDSFQFAGRFLSKHYEQVGNAVPPLVAKSFGHTLKRHVRRKVAASRNAKSSTSLPAFAPPQSARSANMRAIRGNGNRTTEKRLRALLSQRGLGGWTETRMRDLGSPDFVFQPDRVLVFVDGCFWHGCPHCGHIPKTNTPYWRAKLERNRARDLRVTSGAEDRGYTVVRLWECELRKTPTTCVEKVATALRGARNSSLQSQARGRPSKAPPPAVGRRKALQLAG